MTRGCYRGVVTTRHLRFAIHDVTFGGVSLPGATVDCWDDSEGTSRWSARIVTRVGPAIDEGDPDRHGWRTDGRCRVTPSWPIGRSAPAAGARHSSSSTGRASSTASADPRPSSRSPFQVGHEQPRDDLALADHGEAPPPIEADRRLVRATRRHQHASIRICAVERVEQGTRDTPPERPGCHDQPMDVDGLVGEDRPRDGSGQSVLIEHTQPVEASRTQVLERFGQHRDALVADEHSLDRIRLPLERQDGPGDRLVRQVEPARLDPSRCHERRRRQMHSDGQRRAQAIDSASR